MERMCVRGASVSRIRASREEEFLSRVGQEGERDSPFHRGGVSNVERKPPFRPTPGFSSDTSTSSGGFAGCAPVAAPFARLPFVSVPSAVGRGPRVHR